MKYLTILALCIFFITTTTYADIAVIVNPNNPLKMLSKKEVTDLFMGRYVAFPGGMAALPLDQPVNSSERAVFYQNITGRTVAQINAYWAKLIFSGRATPPRVAPDTETIVKMIANNKNAISYVNSKDIDPSVKVVYTIIE